MVPWHHPKTDHACFQCSVVCDPVPSEVPGSYPSWLQCRPAGQLLHWKTMPPSMPPLETLSPSSYSAPLSNASGQLPLSLRTSYEGEDVGVCVPVQLPSWSHAVDQYWDVPGSYPAMPQYWLVGSDLHW